MMSQMTKYEKDTIRRKAASLADQVRKKRCVCVSASACQNERSHLHFHPEIITLASLAGFSPADLRAVTTDQTNPNSPRRAPAGTL